MTTEPPVVNRFESRQWKAVRLGLSIANNNVGANLLTCGYFLFMIFGGLAVVGMLVLHASPDAPKRLEPILLYVFVLPMVLIAAGTWMVRLGSRVLWCSIPNAPRAALLAVISVAGRLSALVACVFVGLHKGPFFATVVLPLPIICAALAWLGLLAEIGFISALRLDVLRSDLTGLAPINSTADSAVADPDRAESQAKANWFTSEYDFEKWSKQRFPKYYRIVGGALNLLGFSAVIVIANMSHPREIPGAILAVLCIAPVYLQIFSRPGGAIDDLTGELGT